MICSVSLSQSAVMLTMCWNDHEELVRSRLDDHSRDQSLFVKFQFINSDLVIHNCTPLDLPHRNAFSGKFFLQIRNCDFPEVEDRGGEAG